MPNNYYEIKMLRLKVLYLLAGWAVIIFAGQLSLYFSNTLLENLCAHSHLFSVEFFGELFYSSLSSGRDAGIDKYEYGRSLYDDLRLFAITPDRFISLHQLDMSPLPGNLGTFYSFHVHDVSEHHHIFSLNLKSIPSIDRGFLMPFWTYLGYTFGLSTDHLSAFVFHRVLSLDTPAEKEKKLYFSFSENL